MENNKKSTVATVLLLIAVLVIGALAGYIYMQKIETDKKIADLEEKISQKQEEKEESQEKEDVVTNVIDSEDIYEKCENKFLNVQYRRETGNSSNFFIKDGSLYAGEEDVVETQAKTTGIAGKVKYVVPVDKQTGIAVVLTEDGKLFMNKEFSNDFSFVLKEYEILDIINISNENELLVIASDGKIFKLDGTLYFDLLNSK